MNLDVRDEADTALELIEAVHAAGRPLADEYPLVFHADGAGRVVVAEQDGEVASTCAILERELVFPDANGVECRLRVGLIGSVSTRAAARGRGLASAVLERAEAELRASGCAIAILWAESPEFYAKRGYAEVGVEQDLLLPSEIAERLPASSAVSGASAADYGEMHSLYRRNERRVERSAAESAVLYATPGMRTLVARDRAGHPNAYLCCGRGHDLAGVVHEWAGDSDAVLECLRALLASEPASEHYLMSPPDLGGLAGRLRELGAPCSNGVLGMAKLLSPDSLLDRLAASSTSPLERRVRPDGTLHIATQRDGVDLTPLDLLGLLVPARFDCAPIERLEARLGTRFEGFPWAPFLWGLDSI